MVSAEDRARMEAAKMQGDILKRQPKNEHVLDSPAPSAVVDPLPTSRMSTPTAMWKSSGFKPFAKFPEKQKRYELYLETVKQGRNCKHFDGKVFLDVLNICAYRFG